MIKRNFYSGATGVFHNEHNEVLEDYLNGVFRKKEKGIIYKPAPIPKGMTKYNKSLLERVDNCIKVFSSFITVNSCVERLLRQHAQDKNDVAGAIRNIYNMQRAQGGTVRFMRMLKDALKTYQVREQAVYDALKKDLSQTEERILRNKVFTMDILKDYGLDKIDAFINETKGIDMFEDAIVFMETIRKTKYHVKDFDILDDYYETCEQEYVNYIMDLAEKNNIDILTNISETAQRHIEIRRKKAKEVHEKYVAYQKDTKEKNTMDALNQDNATLFKIIEGTIEDKHVSAILGPRLEILGGECVYLALRKATCIYYVNENHRLTTAKGGILLFAKDNREEIERVKTEVQTEWPNYKVYELLLGLPKMYISDIKDKNVSKRADSLGYTGNSKLLLDDEAVKKEMQDISAGRNYQHKIALEKQLKKYGSLNYIVYYYKNAIRYYSEKNINNKQLGLATFFKPKDTNVENVKQKIQQQLQLTDNNIKISVLQRR